MRSGVSSILFETTLFESCTRLAAAVGIGTIVLGAGAARAQAPANPTAAAETAKPARTVIAAPRPGAYEVESAHIARYDSAIASVRDQAISPEDADRLKQAISKVGAGDLAAAKTARDQISEPIARKLVDWYRLRGGYGEVREYREFLAANPAWASRDLMIQRYEEALFTERGPARVIKDTLKTEPPRTGAGFAALASAHLADGDEAGAAKYARIAWREHMLGSAIETAFLERFGKLLAVADHKWRLDRLLMDDPRWSGDRSERAAIIRRMLPLLPEAERKRAEARLAVFLRAGNAAALLAALPAEDKDKPDWGLAFQRMQHLRRTAKIEEAAKRLLAAPLESDQIVSPDGWWHERRAIVYETLRLDNARLAYDVARVSGPLSANPLKDQTFHAGWLALAYLKNAKLAGTHFEAMRKAADGPLSRTKAAYWLGRALEAQGRKSESQAAYKEAAAHGDTFHGQLSRAKLGTQASAIHVTPPAAPKPDEIAHFTKLDATRAAVIARKAKLDNGIVRALLSQLQRHFKTEAEQAMVAHLAESLGDTQMAVRLAKSSVARGYNLLVHSYPLHAFPSFSALRTPTPEMALLLAVARQESEFQGQTLSGAGARGILQVMPITARHVCRDYKIKCDIARLMTDNSYNTMLGAAYIGDRMGEFAGSYVLGIAGYNAGPGRARQWIREFGDPRDPAVDPIDWIHRIPFEETREYVQKVLSNVQIYRARLGSGPVKLMVAADLARARGQTAEPAERQSSSERATREASSKEDERPGKALD